MNIPWFLILIFISLSFFYYFSQKAKIKRELRRERFEEKQEELVEMLQNIQAKQKKNN